MKNWCMLSTATWVLLFLVPGKVNAETAAPVAVAKQFLTALANKDTAKALEQSTTPFVFWSTGKKKDCEGNAADSPQLQKKLACILSSKVHARGNFSFLTVLAKVAPSINLQVKVGKTLYTGPAVQGKGYQDLKRKAIQLEPGHSLVTGSAQTEGSIYEIVLLIGNRDGKPTVTGLLIDFEMET